MKTYFKRQVIITIHLDRMSPNREICIVLFQQLEFIKHPSITYDDN